MENETASFQQEDHPLSLSSSLEASIEKLLRYKIIDYCIKTLDDDSDDNCDDNNDNGSLQPIMGKTSGSTVVMSYQLHPQLTCPLPSNNVYSAIQLANNIDQVRHDAECEFWSQHRHHSHRSSTTPKVDIDRVRIVSRSDNDNDNDIDSPMLHERMTALQFKQKYLYSNTPCVITNLKIPITEQWYRHKSMSNPDYPKNGERNGDRASSQSSDVECQINTDWFLENIGPDTLVPIRINQEGYQDGRAAECTTTKVTMKSWIEERKNHPNPQHYLKDWHMQSLFQYLYKDPIVFNDVLNPFLLENDGGDYRFVYWGCKGSSTGIHSDVLNTFSWSYNVFGTKRWTFYHTHDLDGSGEGAIVVDQKQGEMMYVPSGWRHSVVNMEEAISVNHNWMMVGSLDFVFECLLDEIKAIEDEMDAWGMTGVESPGSDSNQLSRVREDMLRGCVGMDISMFCMLVIRYFTDCLIGIVDPVKGADGSIDSCQNNNWECWFDFTRIVKILGKMLDTAIYDERDSIVNDSENEDDKVIIDMQGRLHSTLGQIYAEQTIDLMYSLHDIGCRTIICDDR